MKGEDCQDWSVGVYRAFCCSFSQLCHSSLCSWTTTTNASLILRDDAFVLSVEPTILFSSSCLWRDERYERLLVVYDAVVAKDMPWFDLHLGPQLHLIHLL